jgi:hypothetical protein
MSVIATVKVPTPKIRRPTAPPSKVFKDRKKEAGRRACRGSSLRED